MGFWTNRKLKRLYEGAERGDAAAIFELAEMFSKGDGVSKDDPEAVRWLRSAADLGYAPARHRLGVRYLCGSGVPQNEQFHHVLKGYNGGGDPYSTDSRLAVGVIARQ